MNSWSENIQADETRTSVLVQFFKVLAETKRLKIVGLLAHKPYSVEELSASLGIGSPTVSHHLRKLNKVGLVEARAEGPYSVYSLRPEVLHERARSLLGEEGLSYLAHGTDSDAFDRKVLGTFLDAEGRIQAFPAQQKKYLVLLRYVLEAFEADRRYPETEVNERLSHYNDDTARLRRSLVEHALMAREGGGGAYWRVDKRSNE